MKTDRRFLREFDIPINYTDRMRKRWIYKYRTGGLLDGISTDRMMKAYVRYLDGTRSINMPIGNAFSYLDLFGGRLCHMQPKATIAAAIDSLPATTAVVVAMADAIDREANPHYEAPVKPSIRKAAASVIVERREDRACVVRSAEGEVNIIQTGRKIGRAGRAKK